MPAAKPLHIRQEIVDRREQGESFRSISDEMKLSYDSVRQIWQHWQTHQQLEPNYDACSHPGIRKPQAVWERALALKQEHPRWGAVLIRLHLEDEFGADDLPGERTLQTWFRKAGVNRSPPTTTKQKFVQRGQSPHEVWGVDAKEKMPLLDDSAASWLTVTDEASGAVLEASAFPPQKLVTSSSGTGFEPAA